MAPLADSTILPFLYVSDWRRSQAFYEGMLGLQWLQRTPNWAMVQTLSGSCLALVNEASRYETSDVHRAGVFLTVSSGLADQVAALSAAGVSVVHPLSDHSHGSEAIIADPDGNRIGLYQPATEPQP